jgi:hypothetical protein
MKKKDSLTLTPKELEKYAKADKLGYAEFRRLTGVGPGMHGLYEVSETGVEVPSLSDADLKMLIGNEEALITEQQCHRLTYPYTPAELVDFINTTDGTFELMKGFDSLVRWDGVKAVVSDAVKMQLLNLNEAGQSLGDLARTFPINGTLVTKARISQLVNDGKALRTEKIKKAVNRSSLVGQVAELHKPNT